MNEGKQNPAILIGEVYIKFRDIGPGEVGKEGLSTGFVFLLPIINYLESSYIF